MLSPLCLYLEFGKNAFNWDRFPARNAYVRKVLEPVGVVYVDFWDSMSHRKTLSRLNADNLHYCNPGTTESPSGPMVLLEGLLHLVSLKAAEKLKKLKDYKF